MSLLLMLLHILLKIQPVLLMSQTASSATLTSAASRRAAAPRRSSAWASLEPRGVSAYFSLSWQTTYNTNDGEEAGDEDPLQGWRSQDATGLLHRLLAWHLLPSREQEHRYRQRDKHFPLCGQEFYCDYDRLSEAKVTVFGDLFPQHVKVFSSFLSSLMHRIHWISDNLEIVVRKAEWKGEKAAGWV